MPRSQSGRNRSVTGHRAPDNSTNLQRLLGILEELRAVSQLIVVTHHKRTMEVADSLYGISMRGDGVSTVVSQRMREREPA